MKAFLLLLSVFIVSCSNYGSNLTDVDGNEYSVLKIGSSQWMGENLRVKHDREGQSIKFFYPDSDPTKATQYGLLYDFEATANLCPSGWRVPNNEDWEELFQFNSSNVAGDFKDEDYWSGEINTNSTNFSVRPSGIGNSAEHPNNFKKNTLFWSNDKDQEHFIWTYIFEEGKDSIRKASQHPTYGFSVRCIRE